MDKPRFFLLITNLSIVCCLLWITQKSNAQSLSASATMPNVILIVVDTLRADHLSAYGYDRETTPNLDAKIIEQGATFNAYTSSPWTCPSNAALLTGRIPSILGATWHTMGQSIPSEETTLAEYLKNAGYYTVGFTSRPYCVQGNLGFSQGFNYYDDGVINGEPTGELRAGDLNRLIFNWLDTTTLSSEQSLFLFAYYFDPHTYYDPPQPYNTLYDPDYDGELTPTLFGHGQTAKEGTIVISDRDLQHLLALYDGEITYWDAQFGQLITKLEIHGLLEDTLIIITSDHGEMFGEHNQWSHAGSLYEEVLRVPLLIRYTGVISAGMQIADPVQSMDVMPTILDYVGIPLPDNIQAISLRGVLSGQEQEPRPVYSEVDAINDPNHNLYWAASRTDLRSVRNGGWKFIHHLQTSAQDELYLLNDTSSSEMINIAWQNSPRSEMSYNLLQKYFDFNDVFYPVHMYLPSALR